MEAEPLAQRSKAEYLRVMWQRYQRADRVTRSGLPDEVTRVCGYHRKYAIRLLSQKHLPRLAVRRVSRRRPTYGMAPADQSPANRSPAAGAEATHQTGGSTARRGRAPCSSTTRSPLRRTTGMWANPAIWRLTSSRIPAPRPPASSCTRWTAWPSRRRGWNDRPSWAGRSSLGLAGRAFQSNRLGRPCGDRRPDGRRSCDNPAEFATGQLVAAGDGTDRPRRKVRNGLLDRPLDSMLTKYFVGSEQRRLLP